MGLNVRLGCLWLLLVVNHEVSDGQVCDWDWSMDADQDLDPRSLDAGARHLALLRDVRDAEHCQAACCANPECQLAMIGSPADGAPECFLVACMKNGTDVCVLQPGHQFQIYRKTTLQKKDAAAPLSVEERNSTNTDRCRRPMKVGLCRAYFPRFYYDVTNQSCRSFVYGGCDANGNNFESQEECEAACGGVTGSVLPEDSSSSSKASRRLPLLPAQDQSPQISLDAKAEGRSTSADAEQPVPSTPPPEMPADDFVENCGAEPVVGPCRASLRRWFYDSNTHACQPFNYGGCRGNKNNYVTMESCMATCTVTVLPAGKARGSGLTEDVAKDYQESCMAESETGPCRAAFNMYYWQASTGTCQSFIYGGCGGNKNRYETLEGCMSHCSDAQGRLDAHGHAGKRDRWTPAFFLVGTLAVISVLCLSALILITLRRNRVTRRHTSVSDKEELLPDQDERFSVDSLSIPESLNVGTS